MIITAMKRNCKRSIYILLPLLVGMLIASCVPQRKVLYLQDLEGARPATSFENKLREYRVQSGDYLYIRIFTMDKDANEIFSDMSGISNYGVTDQNIYLNSYQVSDSGYINFPILGKIKAAGLLLSEIEKELFDLTLKDVNNPGVVVRLVNFRISVLGEVKAPGTFTVNQNNISIFQALSLAGDLTTYSNRNSVKLLRKQGEQMNIISLDLTRKEILTSEYFYLKPGDVIYVEPLNYKQYAFESFPYALVLSGLSTLLVVLTFFKI
jgi:polysaccharide biosynthesis/export protein